MHTQFNWIWPGVTVVRRCGRERLWQHCWKLKEIWILSVRVCKSFLFIYFKDFFQEFFSRILFTNFCYSVWQYFGTVWMECHAKWNSSTQKQLYHQPVNTVFLHQPSLHDLLHYPQPTRKPSNVTDVGPEAAISSPVPEGTQSKDKKRAILPQTRRKKKYKMEDHTHLSTIWE